MSTCRATQRMLSSAQARTEPRRWTGPRRSTCRGSPRRILALRSPILDRGQYPRLRSARPQTPDHWSAFRFSMTMPPWPATWPRCVIRCGVCGVSRPPHQPSACLFRRWLAFLQAFRNRGTPCRNRRALPSEESRGHPRRALAADNVCSELSAWSCVDLPLPGCRDGPFQQPWPTAAARHRASTATHGWLFVTVERWPPLSSAIADSAPMNTERLNSPRCPEWGSPRGSCAPAHPQRRRHSNGRRSDGLRRVSRSG